MPHLPPSWAEHLDTGVSNRLAACDVTGRPEICRALASRQRADGRIDVLLAADVGQHVIAAVQATQRVAHVTAHPGTSRTLHLKGRDAEVVPAEPDHMELLVRCRQRFGAALEPYGYDDEALRRVVYDVDLALLRCVRFTPFGAWDATPGIGAGAAIELLA